MAIVVGNKVYVSEKKMSNVQRSQKLLLGSRFFRNSFLFSYFLLLESNAPLIFRDAEF